VKKPLFGSILIATALASGCRHVQPPPPVTFGSVPAGSFVRKSTADLLLKNDAVQSLYLRDELLIVYTQNHDAYSLARNGLVLESLAEVTSPASHLGPPVVFQQAIIYPTNTTLEVYAHDGRKIRQIDVQRAMRSPVVGAGSTLYMGVDYNTGGRVIAIDPDRPQVPIRWEFLTRSGIAAAPAVVNNIIYVGAEDGQVIAAQDQGDDNQPLEIFHFATAGTIVADLKADDTGVYVASTDTKLYCLDLNTGHIQWQYYAQHPLTKSPTVTATRVYQAVPNVGLVAIDKEHGLSDRRPLWIAKNVAQILSEDDRCVYTRLSDNAIAAIDKETGQQLFVSHRRDFTAFATNTRDATIYAATADGKIYEIVPVFHAGMTGEVVLRERRMKAEG
jgi:outer membrane protein assembly factor BamB